MVDASIPQVLPEAGSPNSVFNLPALLRILRLQRGFLLTSAVSGGLLLFGVSLLLKNSYKATALVMPPDHSSSSLSMLASSASIPTGALAALNMKMPSDLYVALMQSPAVEDAVIDRFNLQALYKNKLRSGARKELENRMRIVADTKSGLISVSATDKDPNRAAAIVNETVTAFDQLSDRLAITDAARRRLFFERQVNDVKAKLAHAEDALRETSARTGIVEPEGSARALIGYEAQLRTQIAAKSVELQSLETYDSEQNPEVLTVRRELQALQSQVSALQQKNGESGSAPSKTAQSEAALDYARKLREVRLNEAVFELLTKNLTVARLDEAREGNVIQVVSFATPPDVKDGPHRSFFFAGGFLLGILFAVIWVLVRFLFPEEGPVRERPAV